MPRGVNFLQRQNKFFWSLGLANPKPTLGVGEGGKEVGGWRARQLESNPKLLAKFEI